MHYDKMSCLLLYLLCIISGRVSATLTETIQKSDGVETGLNRNDLVAQYERLEAHESEIEESLQRSPQQEQILERIVRSTPVEETTHFRSMGDTIEEVNRHAGLGKLLYQSDIVLTDEQFNDIIDDIEAKNGRKKRQAVNKKIHGEQVWPNGVVYYYFHSQINVNISRLFMKGIAQWSSQTCIDFVENRFAITRIQIASHEEGCWTTVGPVMYKAQRLNLGEGCDLIGSVVHEIGHILGFWHTQARMDRDRYILLLLENIERDEGKNFLISDSTKNENYGIPYDFGSVMHYGSKMFSVNDNHTMFPIDERYIDTMGSPFISFYDLLMMNILYDCLGKCKHNPRTAKCKMGGFPNPRDCTKCVCPGGYGGRLCDERPAGCGKVLQATTTYQELNDTIGDNNIYLSNQADDYKMCHYWIQAPKGRKVEVRIKHFSHRNVVIDGCFIAGFEIKSQRDQGMTGYRYCSPAYIGKYFVSHNNLLPIITWSKAWAVTVSLVYKYI
ncbi:unnamed protein product [Cylicocyclus nassatus]|uniref:Zinc metalloproteinase n=1 Tax=Cylicocyclus nassatus TaxID=53992 RepID=A0AA36H2E5_CYLNA|nr:unnamed protein product [Cylicocyclus nassatus]